MKPNKHATQGRLLIAELKRRPMTYAQMIDHMRHVSTSPWKRAVECLRPGEEIIRAKNARGLVTWRVRTTYRISHTHT